MINNAFQILNTDGITAGDKAIKAWINGVPVEEAAKLQLMNVAKLPFIYKHIAVMPDVHLGIGCTIGSVIATQGAIIPAAAGCDLGCGIIAAKLSLKAGDLPGNLAKLRSDIESAIPVGRTDNGGANDRGSWGNPPEVVIDRWNALEERYRKLIDKHPKISHRRPINQLGTLGSSNHFWELCLDESNNVWAMLHSGSRGPGAAIGNYFLDLARQEMKRFFINLPDSALAYLPDGTQYQKDYIEAVGWAQEYAFINRELMLELGLKQLRKHTKKFEIVDTAINCHHNYVAREHHFGNDVWITRKGACQARKGTMAVIPSSMGTKSFIVMGKGEPESFTSCSHGAGRKMSRTVARATITLKDHREAMKGIEARLDKEVIDESPAAYKDIDQVMSAQDSLVSIVATLKQVLCVKG